MALDTYTGLLASLARIAVRDDLTAEWPDYVSLAEAEFNRTLQVRPMLGRSTVTVESEYLTQPSDLIGPKSFVLHGDPDVKLSHVSQDEIDQMSARADAYALEVQETWGRQTPAWYAVVGDSFRFFPEPTTTQTGELTYWKRIPALSEAIPSNWLLTAHPDAYLYGALVQFAMSKEDPRLEAFTAAYARALDGVNRAYPAETRKTVLRTDFPLFRCF